jgi:hypothetical protein
MLEAVNLSKRHGGRARARLVAPIGTSWRDLLSVRGERRGQNDHHQPVPELCGAIVWRRAVNGLDVTQSPRDSKRFLAYVPEAVML